MSDSITGPIFTHGFGTHRPGLKERLKMRKHGGPYQWMPAKPGLGRGFYQSSDGLDCDNADSTFRLRLQDATTYLRGSRYHGISGYYVDKFMEETLKPIVALLPHGRGYLAGWTMGPGMCGTIAPEIHLAKRDAAIAAHELARYDAELACEANETRLQEEAEELREDRREAERLAIEEAQG